MLEDSHSLISQHNEEPQSSKQGGAGVRSDVTDEQNPKVNPQIQSQRNFHKDTKAVQLKLHMAQKRI